jgi:hypothetical protein
MDPEQGSTNGGTGILPAYAIDRLEAVPTLVDPARVVLAGDFFFPRVSPVAIVGRPLQGHSLFFATLTGCYKYGRCFPDFSLRRNDGRYAFPT